ncbi:MAG TPA: hypothetical protein DIW17_17235 [Clostridiales bacterium]|nr:hypothetical protein [Clostridiales bacterium]
MAQETIDRICKAEQAANHTEEKASEESERILQEARTRAEELINEISAESQNAARAKLEAAQQQGEQIMTEGRKQAEEEIAKLSKIAAEKEREAMQVVLSELYPVLDT